MSFLDIFKSREERAKLSHLKNLIGVAVADGKIEETEVAAIAAVISREGINPKEFDRIMKHPESVKLVIPETDSDKIAYLKDMVFLMMVDGDIDAHELALCKATALAYGYRHEIVDAMILDIIAEIKRNIGK